MRLQIVHHPITLTLAIKEQICEQYILNSTTMAQECTTSPFVAKERCAVRAFGLRHLSRENINTAKSVMRLCEVLNYYVHFADP